MEKLQALLDDGIIDEIHSQLKSGKEAEVWLVSHRGEAVAAKLYKEREFRNFKNDAGYKEGRQVRNSRTQRAMDKGSKFGRQASEDAWKSAEADAMETLHKLGVHVPKPVLFYDGVLLMEVIGDAEGRVAPRLVEAAISREQAGELYARLRGDVVKMLAADLIHGDLSEFNILLGANGPVIIDFPQVVTAAKNSQSEQYFRRDVGNLLRFFSSIDPALNQKHEHDAEEIWRAYVRRHLSPHFTPSGRPQQSRRGGPEGFGGQSRGNQPQQPRRGPEVSFSGPPRGNQPQQPRRAPEGSEPQRNNQPRRGPEVSFSGPPRSNQPQQPRRAPEGSEPQRNNQPRRGPEVSFSGPPRSNQPQQQRRAPEVGTGGPPRANHPPRSNQRGPSAAPDSRSGGARRRPKRRF